MQFINYLFASLVSFFGLAIGILLIKIAPEEQKPLKTYLAPLRRTALAAENIFGYSKKNSIIFHLHFFGCLLLSQSLFHDFTFNFACLDFGY